MQVDENTRSSTSDDMSSLYSSSDSEVPDFFQPPQDHDTGQLSAPNEVVSGHQFQTNFLEKVSREISHLPCMKAHLSFHRVREFPT